MTGIPDIRPRTAMGRIIVALDVSTLDEALRLAYWCSVADVRWFKVGMELWADAGPRAVEALRMKGRHWNVFLDLKLNDIPITVSRTITVILKKCRPNMISVQGETPYETVRAAISGAETALWGMSRSWLPQILYVPQLSSVTSTDTYRQGISPDLDEHGRPYYLKARSVLAIRGGAAGIITSGRNVEFLRNVLPRKDAIIVSPGIRSAVDEQSDHAQPLTARQAVEAGADFVVVGRAVRDAKSASEVYDVLQKYALSIEGAI